MKRVMVLSAISSTVCFISTLSYLESSTNQDQGGRSMPFKITIVSINKSKIPQD